MITNALPTISSRLTGPKNRLSWLRLRLSPITKYSSSGPVSGSLRSVEYGDDDAVATDLDGLAWQSNNSFDLIGLRSPHANRLCQVAEQRPDEAFIGVRGAIEYDHVAALRFAEAVADLVDQHSIVDLEGVLHGSGWDVEGLEGKGLGKDRQQQRNQHQHRQLGKKRAALLGRSGLLPEIVGGSDQLFGSLG